jgi:hypothetical protein
MPNGCGSLHRFGLVVVVASTSYYFVMFHAVEPTHPTFHLSFIVVCVFFIDLRYSCQCIRRSCLENAVDCSRLVGVGVVVDSEIRTWRIFWKRVIYGYCFL